MAESARQALTQHARAAGLGHAKEENLALAAEPGKPLQSACPTQAASDEALERELAHLSRQ